MKRVVGIVVTVILLTGVVLCFIPAVNTTGLIPLCTAAALAAASVWALVEMVKLGRDEQYAHVTPGDSPLPGDSVDVTYKEVTDAPVRFTPPKGIPPRLVGAIVRERTASADLVATIISMAVRGHIRLTVGTRSKELIFTAVSPDLTLLDRFERRIYHLMFRKATTVSQSDLSKSGFFTADFKLLSQGAQQEFEAQKWYKDDPAGTVSFTRWVGILIAVVGTVAVLILSGVLSSFGLHGLAWLAIPCLVLGVGMAVIAKRMPTRTVTGSIVAVQAFGFKKYLETAEADQLRWEEGHDIFSEYLPYAISFGCTKHWTALFEQLAVDGAALPQPTWLTGVMGTMEVVGSFAEIILDIASLLDGLSSVAEALDELTGVGEIVGGIADALSFLDI